MLPSAFGSPATTPDRGGVIPGMQPSGARSSWATSSQNGRPVSYNSRGGRAPLPYIKDLQDQAAHLEVDETSPVWFISVKWSWNMRLMKLDFAALEHRRCECSAMPDFA